MARNRIVYTGRVFKVGVKKLRFSGKIVDYSTVFVGEVVGVVPVLDDGRIVLERIYRDTINKWLYELPAGHVEKGESPKRAGIRELAEETGYRAKKARLLFRGSVSPGMTDEVINIFVATGLKRGRPDKEASERINVKIMTLSKALQLARSSKGMDLKTVAGILFYANYVLKGQPKSKQSYK